MKHYCIIILLAVIPVFSSAQLQLGVKGGCNYYWFTNTDEGHLVTTYDYLDSQLPPMISLTLRDRSPGNFNIGVELDYIFRSFWVNSFQGGLAGSSDVDIRYQIGNLYLQIQPQFVFGSKMKFFFYPGLYLGTLLHSSVLGSTASYQQGVPPVTRYHEINGKAGQYYPKLEVGVCAGTGIEVSLGRNFGFLAEYNFRMNLSKIGSPLGADNVKMINMTIEAGVTYTLNLKKKKA